jgi:hypothetical protein
MLKKILLVLLAGLIIIQFFHPKKNKAVVHNLIILEITFLCPPM